MEKRFEITLADGTKISDLVLNGNNYISKSEITEDIFKGNLTSVTISDGETEETLTNCELIQIREFVPGEWWFIIREIPADVQRQREIQANIEYIAMMTDVNLEVGEV